MDILGAAILMPLVQASLQGAAVVAAVWLLCRLIPRLPAAVRCSLWWLVCAKLALGLVWTAPVRLALLPALEPEPVVTAAAAQPLAPGTSPGSPGSEEMNRSMRLPGRDSWKTVALAVWGIGILILLVGTVQQLRQARQVIRRARPVDEPWLADLFADLRQRTGAPERTGLRLSSEIETPQVSGLVHPVVLLPDSASARLSRSEMAMSLCHELLHVRRGDLWLGWVPFLAQRLFFFHPLAHLAAREYALAREAACDADVLRVLDPAPETYGHLLVRLGVTPRPPKLAAAGAAPSYRILERRLTMLQNATDKKRLHPAWWALVALSAVVLLVPFIITAQEAPQGGGEDAYVLLLGKDTSVMGGSPPAFDQARELQRSEDDQLFWFQHDQRQYVIRDAATLDQISELFEPQMKLGDEMAQLSDQQTALTSESSKGDHEKEMKRVYVYEEKGNPGEREEQAGELGQRHEELGRQQEEAIRNAEEQLRALMSAAISNGTAQEVR
jgi:beta-lactamase regulating signal transducer with metallopeptidase domain